MRDWAKHQVVVCVSCGKRWQLYRKDEIFRDRETLRCDHDRGGCGEKIFDYSEASSYYHEPIDAES